MYQNSPHILSAASHSRAVCVLSNSESQERRSLLPKLTVDRMAGGIVAVSAHLLLGEELLVETSSVCTECWQPEPCAPGISLPPGSPRLAWLVPPSPIPAFPAPWLPPHSPAPWDSTLGENHFLVQGRDSPRG